MDTVFTNSTLRASISKFKYKCNKNSSRNGALPKSKDSMKLVYSTEMKSLAYGYKWIHVKYLKQKQTHTKLNWIIWFNFLRTTNAKVLIVEKQVVNAYPYSNKWWILGNLFKSKIKAFWDKLNMQFSVRKV